jgi:hypothetical protein
MPSFCYAHSQSYEGIINGLNASAELTGATIIPSNVIRINSPRAEEAEGGCRRSARRNLTEPKLEGEEEARY